MILSLNGFSQSLAERCRGALGWECDVGTCSNHVIVLHQRHLRRLLKDYIRYYREELPVPIDSIGFHLRSIQPGRRLG